MRPRYLGAIFALTVLGICGTYVAIHDRFSDIPFDSVGWRDTTFQRAPTIRERMADHLIADNALSGKSRDEVVAMLGEPPETAYFRNWDLVYHLGPERGFFGIDSEWLVVRFGEDDHVAEYRIVHD